MLLSLLSLLSLDFLNICTLPAMFTGAFKSRKYSLSFKLALSVRDSLFFLIICIPRIAPLFDRVYNILEHCDIERTLL